MLFHACFDGILVKFIAKFSLHFPDLIFQFWQSCFWVVNNSIYEFQFELQLIGWFFTLLKYLKYMLSIKSLIFYNGFVDVDFSIEVVLKTPGYI